MFKVSVPIHLKEDTDKYEVLQILKDAGAEYAFLAFDNLVLSAIPENNAKTFAIMKEFIPFLQNEGYKVGVYFWSLWLGDIEEDELLSEVMIRANGTPKINRTALNSNEKRLSGFICPTSKKIECMLDIIRLAAEYHPDIILLNDDMGYATYLESIGCYCDRHLAMIREKLGQDISREELRQAVAFGKPNEIRSIWYEITGKSLEYYALRIRQVIDSVDSSIRCGFCCVMSNWGIDGTTAEKIAKLLAGNTRPMIRLIGAPYWAATKAWGNRLQQVIELSRMEAAWVEDNNIELVVEGDVYPRPRHRVPASFLEIYDTAIRAAGCCDGIFKLMLDYNSSLHYEQGYLSRHIRNRSLNRKIAELFDGKTPVGVRVYETMDKITQADFTGIANPESYAANSFFSYASRMLADNTIPTIYEGNCGVGIAFGENARHLPKEAFENGLILDIRAARILMEQGIDVGIASIDEEMNNNLLYFPVENERILTNYRGQSAYKITPKENAEVVIYSLKGEQKFADAIHYVNDHGMRFLVYAFDGAFVDENRYRNYCTQSQLCRSIQWLSQKQLPAICNGNPDLYILCREDSHTLSIGIWNIFADDIPQPEILLGKPYRSAKFVGCEGALFGNKLHLSPVAPYGYAFIELTL